MTKVEVNIIIQACMGYRIFNTCRQEGDVYVINLQDQLDFKSFEAAKLAVNSLVIENRNKPKTVESESNLKLTGLNFSRYPTKKKMNTEPGNWAERRMKD
jgi:hypothetical protein